MGKMDRWALACRQQIVETAPASGNLPCCHRPAPAFRPRCGEDAIRKEQGGSFLVKKNEDIIVKAFFSS